MPDPGGGWFFPRRKTGASFFRNPAKREYARRLGHGWKDHRGYLPDDTDQHMRFSNFPCRARPRKGVIFFSQESGSQFFSGFLPKEGTPPDSGTDGEITAAFNPTTRINVCGSPFPHRLFFGGRDYAGRRFFARFPAGNPRENTDPHPKKFKKGSIQPYFAIDRSPSIGPAQPALGERSIAKYGWGETENRIR